MVMCYLFLAMSEETKTWSISRLLDWTSNFFLKKGLHAPRLSAELLLAKVAGWDRIDLYTRFDHILSPEQLDRFRNFVKRAASGYPVSYILGEKEFYSINFAVNPHVLIPRPESELLVDAAVDYLRYLDVPGCVWDVCTGCGCVAAAIALNAPVSRVLATDISREAVEVASTNIEALGLGNFVTVCCSDLLDVPPEWNGKRVFDCITANPPYVASDEPLGFSVDNEPAIALQGGNDGLDLIRPLVAGAAGLLKSGGLFCIEFGLGQADAVQELFDKSDQFEIPDILNDIQDLPRTVVARRKIHRGCLP